MSEHNIRKHRNGNVIEVAQVLDHYGIVGAVRRLYQTLERRAIGRFAQLAATNKELEKEVAERKRLEEELRNLALTDELTWLYNRRGFLTLAVQQLKLARRMGSGLSLVYADLDALKRINDTFGHGEGDAALCQVAGILRKTFRDSDIIARLGGDEFAVLVLETSYDSPEIILSRLQEKLANYNAQRTHPYELSLSAGIATLNHQIPVPIEELIAQADQRMYEHKRGQEKSLAAR